jgi:hypothetical protein
MSLQRVPTGRIPSELDLASWLVNRVVKVSWKHMWLRWRSVPSRQKSLVQT